MAKSLVHYEIFLRKMPKASWQLVDAIDDREKAIKRGNTLSAENPHGGVKVLKETLVQETGSYRSVTFMTFGDCEEQVNKKNKRMNTPTSTTNCLGAADLFKANARRTIQETMSDYMQKYRLLPIELVSRPDVVERLEANPMEITQAIQKVAIVRSRGGEDLHGIVRQMQELVSQAANKLFTDHKKKIFTDFDEAKIAETITKLHGQSASEYKLGFFIADGLKSKTTWNDKLNHLIDVWARTVDLAPEVRIWAQTHLEATLEEWLMTPAAMKSLTEDAASSGDALEILIKILEGKDEGLTPSARSLMFAIDKGLILGARRQVMRRIFSILAGVQRLYPNDLEHELQKLRNFGDRLVKLTDSKDQYEMVQAFQERSNRLMVVETIEEYLQGTPAEERPGQMLDLADNLVGPTAKARLCSLIRGEVSHTRFDRALRENGRKPLAVLKALRRLQDKFLECELPPEEMSKSVLEISEAAARLANESQIIVSLAKRSGSRLQVAAALFQLAANDLPRGYVSKLAADSARRLLSTDEARTQIQQNPQMVQVIAQLSRSANEASLQAA